MNIDIGSRIKDKEINSSKINKDNNMAIVKNIIFLELIKFTMFYF